MPGLKKIIYYWGPPILWMALIFILSSRQRITISEESAINFIIFKTLHIIEYATLYFLLFRAFTGKKNSKSNVKHLVAYSFIISILYAISDEIHQTFVPTREGHIRDVFIDFIGIFLMYSYLKRRKL